MFFMDIFRPIQAIQPTRIVSNTFIRNYWPILHIKLSLAFFRLFLYSAASNNDKSILYSSHHKTTFLLFLDWNCISVQLQIYKRIVYEIRCCPSSKWFNLRKYRVFHSFHLAKTNCYHR